MEIYNNDIHSLTEHIKIGEVSAFEKLYEIMSRKVFRYAFSFLANKEDAEEIMHDVFLKVWEEKGKLNTDKSIERFIYTITRNATFDRIRKYNRKNSRLREYFQTNQQKVMEYPDEQYDGKELEQLIFEIISHMPPRQRRIFELNRIQGMSSKSISEYLGITPSAVDKQMHKALQSLREELEKRKIPLSLILFITFMFS